MYQIFCWVCDVAVDDDVVEKLLLLLSHVDTSDSAKADFSLKSVAAVLFKEQQWTDSVDNNFEDSCDISVNADGLPLLQILPSLSDVVSSTSDNQIASSQSSPMFPALATSSVEKSSHNVVTNGSCSSHRSVPCMVNTNIVEQSPNAKHSPNICMPNSSPTAVTSPYFYVPTLPVLSSQSVTSARGDRRHNQHICNTTVEQAHCDVRMTEDAAISYSAMLNKPVVSSNFCQNMQNTSACQSPKLADLQFSDSVPCLSSLRPILCNNSSVDRCQRSSRTLRTITDAANRVSQLLSAQLKVLVLMRGCPGSGKTTMATYVLLVDITPC